jgi:hypothetical protein
VSLEAEVSAPPPRGDATGIMPVVHAQDTTASLDSGSGSDAEAVGVAGAGDAASATGSATIALSAAGAAGTKEGEVVGESVEPSPQPPPPPPPQVVTPSQQLEESVRLAVTAVDGVMAATHVTLHFSRIPAAPAEEEEAAAADGAEGEREEELGEGEEEEAAVLPPASAEVVILCDSDLVLRRAGLGREQSRLVQEELMRLARKARKAVEGCEGVHLADIHLEIQDRYPSSQPRQ